MKLENGKTYTVRLLRAKSSLYGIPYGEVGDVIELKHNVRYARFGALNVLEGHGYGTDFVIGVDVEIVTD